MADHILVAIEGFDIDAIFLDRRAGARLVVIGEEKE
jgi:hypothetical protein